MWKTERKSCRKQNANHEENITQIMWKTERKPCRKQNANHVETEHKS